MNTIAASTRRVPRSAFIGLAVLIAAFAALMVVRAGVIGGSTDAVPVATPSPNVVTPAKPVQPVSAKPRVVLLPDLPAQVRHKLLYSKVIVVSLYAGSADRATIASARKGARTSGAGFASINVIDDRNARAVATFAGEVSSPTLLVVRRPGKIVNRFPGTVDSAIVTQAAHNAGARR